MEQQPTPTNNLNFHQKKLYSLVMAAAGLLGLILPWLKVSMGGLGGGTSVNGFQGWGILSLFGVIGVIVACLNGEKTKTFDQQMRYLALAGFASLALGAFIYFMQVSGNGNGLGATSSGIGIWFCILSGVGGLLWVGDVIKMGPTPPAK